MADAVQSQNPPARKPLTHERLLELLDYDPYTGIFTWKMIPPKGKGRARHKPGSVAGSSCKGHIHIKIDQRLYYAHRLAWFYVYGQWPAKSIDHKDRKKDDNRITSLREADNHQQGFNTGAKKNSKSGIKGVDWSTKMNRWRSRIRCDQGRINLGYFSTKEEAGIAYAKAAARLHGEFANPTIQEVETKCVFAPLGAS